MTREEALIWFEKLGKSVTMSGARAAFLAAIRALRPVSREQVERMRGEWLFPIFVGQKDANDPRCQCAECGSIETPLARH